MVSSQCKNNLRQYDMQNMTRSVRRVYAVTTKCVSFRRRNLSGVNEDRRMYLFGKSKMLFELWEHAFSGSVWSDPSSLLKEEPEYLSLPRDPPNCRSIQSHDVLQGVQNELCVSSEQTHTSESCRMCKTELRAGSEQGCLRSGRKLVGYWPSWAAK